LLRHVLFINLINKEVKNGITVYNHFFHVGIFCYYMSFLFGEKIIKNVCLISFCFGRFMGRIYFVKTFLDRSCKKYHSNKHFFLRNLYWYSNFVSAKKQSFYELPTQLIFLLKSCDLYRTIFFVIYYFLIYNIYMNPVSSRDSKYERREIL